MLSNGYTVVRRENPFKQDGKLRVWVLFEKDNKNEKVVAVQPSNAAQALYGPVDKSKPIDKTIVTPPDPKATTAAQQPQPAVNTKQTATPDNSRPNTPANDRQSTAAAANKQSSPASAATTTTTTTKKPSTAPTTKPSVPKKPAATPKPATNPTTSANELPTRTSKDAITRAPTLAPARPAIDDAVARLRAAQAAQDAALAAPYLAARAAEPVVNHQPPAPPQMAMAGLPGVARRAYGEVPPPPQSPSPSAAARKTATARKPPQPTSALRPSTAGARKASRPAATHSRKRDREEQHDDASRAAAKKARLAGTRKPARGTVVGREPYRDAAGRLVAAHSGRADAVGYGRRDGVLPREWADLARTEAVALAEHGGMVKTPYSNPFGKK